MIQLSLLPKTISSISFSQDEILRDIVTLYVPNGIEVDCTYSIGRFYKYIKQPKHKFDLFPQKPDVIKASSEQLPLEDLSIRSLMFDPPFIAAHSVESEDYHLEKRFTIIKGIKNLHSMYAKSIIEFGRIIKKRGVLIVKCQDCVYGRKNYFNHIFIHDCAICAGFNPIDLFILLARSRFIGSGEQFHSRKFHSYFWVFKKL